MKLTRLDRSESKHNGWIIEGSNQREMLKITKYLMKSLGVGHTIDIRPLRFDGGWWVSNRGLFVISVHFDNFETMARKAGYWATYEKLKQSKETEDMRYSEYARQFKKQEKASFQQRNDPVLFEAYRILNLPMMAPWEMVRLAYHKMSMIHHPDRGGSHEMMVRINTAYQTLKQQKRI